MIHPSLDMFAEALIAEAECRRLGEDSCKVRYANLSVYGGEGPVLEAENIEPAEPIEELVYFN